MCCFYATAGAKNMAKLNVKIKCEHFFCPSMSEKYGKNYKCEHVQKICGISNVKNGLFLCYLVLFYSSAGAENIAKLNVKIKCEHLLCPNHDRFCSS